MWAENKISNSEEKLPVALGPANLNRLKGSGTTILEQQEKKKALDRK